MISMAERFRRAHWTAVLVMPLVAVLLSACGSTDRKPTAGVAQSVRRVTAPEQAIATVGATPITNTVYEHWMAIGAATLHMPPPSGPLPRPVPYRPPEFSACVANLRATAPHKATSIALLRARCRSTYESIQRRILNFLISGGWIRGEAAADHVSVTSAEVRRRFDEERRGGYPSSAAFRRFQKATGQTVPDLLFAIQTQMLSAKLLQHFAAQTHAKSEEASIAAFNGKIVATWTRKTNCAPGYVVPDCRQYEPPSTKHTSK